jgi:hypothetical protein
MYLSKFMRSNKTFMYTAVTFTASKEYKRKLYNISEAGWLNIATSLMDTIKVDQKQPLMDSLLKFVTYNKPLE